MKKVLNYIKLLRIKNWIKNLLILFPFVYSARFLKWNFNDYKTIFFGVLCFSLTSSSVYIINDICDADRDKLDAKKKHRPIASGAVSKKQAIYFLTFIIAILLVCIFFLHNYYCAGILFIYFSLNMGYSFKWKNIPILDISLLSIFFLLRVLFGGTLLNIGVSNYLYLTTLSAAYYFGAGKRLKEAQQGGEMRIVLKEYPLSYLESITNMFLGMTIMFYSLWAMTYDTNIMNQNLLAVSIFIVIAILLSYHYCLHKNTNGNPTDMLLENKYLILLGALYCLIILLAFFI